MTTGSLAEGAGPDPASARLPSRVAKLLSALFYGTCSFLIVLVNKALLTTYRTPRSCACRATPQSFQMHPRAETSGLNVNFQALQELPSPRAHCKLYCATRP